MPKRTDTASLLKHIAEIEAQPRKHPKGSATAILSHAGTFAGEPAELDGLLAEMEAEEEREIRRIEEDWRQG